MSDVREMIGRGKEIEKQSKGGIKQAPFTPYHLEEDRDQDKSITFTIRLNEEEQAMLSSAKKLLNQSKDSTAMKQLAEIGSVVLHDDLMGGLLQVIFKNKVKNARSGAEVE